MQQLRNVIVTGSNKGIGFAIAENLASKDNWNIIMAVRNLELGEVAKNEIQTKFPNAKLFLEKLDVSDPASIASFVPNIKGKFNQIDVIINNAGVAAKGDDFGPEVVQFTFPTNFYGTIDFTEKMLPVLANQGKIITIGSTAGRMSFNKITNENLKQRFTDPKITQSQLLELIKEFENAVADKTYADKGWPKWIYGISKLGINIYCNILGKRQDVLERGIQVYACCPGYVKTEMTSHKGVLTLDQGIKTPIYLVQLPFQVNKQLQGGFFYECKLSSTFA